MASELWIEELKQKCQLYIAIENDKYVEITAQDLLKLIELATTAPPLDALTQCQGREEDLKQEVEELEHETWTLRHENEALELRVEQLEEESERNLRA